MSGNRTEILVDVEPVSEEPAPQYTEIEGVVRSNPPGSTVALPHHPAPTTTSSSTLLGEHSNPDSVQVAVVLHSVPSYQNQTAEDIASGRTRVDSVGSYASDGSEEALLPNSEDSRSKVTSPRRGGQQQQRRENAPLLSSQRQRGRRGEGESYDDIEDISDDNVWPGTSKNTLLLAWSQ